MRTLLVICTILSLLITAYCLFEYQLPRSQFTKALSDLKSAGIDDPDLVSRIRWDIIGVQTTWRPLLILTFVENILMIAVTICSFRRSMAPKTVA